MNLDPVIPLSCIQESQNSSQEILQKRQRSENKTIFGKLPIEVIIRICNFLKNGERAEFRNSHKFIYSITSDFTVQKLLNRSIFLKGRFTSHKVNNFFCLLEAGEQLFNKGKNPHLPSITWSDLQKGGKAEPVINLSPEHLPSHPVNFNLKTFIINNYFTLPGNRNVDANEARIDTIFLWQEFVAVTEFLFLGFSLYLLHRIKKNLIILSESFMGSDREQDAYNWDQMKVVLGSCFTPKMIGEINKLNQEEIARFGKSLRQEAEAEQPLSPIPSVDDPRFFKIFRNTIDFVQMSLIIENYQSFPCRDVEGDVILAKIKEQTDLPIIRALIDIHTGFRMMDFPEDSSELSKRALLQNLDSIIVSNDIPEEFRRQATMMKFFFNISDPISREKLDFIDVAILARRYLKKNEDIPLLNFCDSRQWAIYFLIWMDRKNIIRAPDYRGLCMKQVNIFIPQAIRDFLKYTKAVDLYKNGLTKWFEGLTTDFFFAFNEIKCLELKKDYIILICKVIVNGDNSKSMATLCEERNYLYPNLQLFSDSNKPELYSREVDIWFQILQLVTKEITLEEVPNRVVYMKEILDRARSSQEKLSAGLFLAHLYFCLDQTCIPYEEAKKYCLDFIAESPCCRDREMASRLLNKRPLLWDISNDRTPI